MTLNKKPNVIGGPLDGEHRPTKEAELKQAGAVSFLYRHGRVAYRYVLNKETLKWHFHHSQKAT